MVKVNVTVNNWTERHRFTSSKKSQGIDQITLRQTDRRRNVIAAKCQSGEMSFGEISARRKVLEAQCPSDEMSGSEKSGGEMSGDEITGGEMSGQR